MSGDLLLCEMESRRATVGDLVVFADVVHRLVCFDFLGGVWECGDAPQAKPRRRARGEVQGRVMAVARAGRWVETRLTWRTRLRQYAGVLLQITHGVWRRLYKQNAMA